MPKFDRSTWPTDGPRKRNSRRRQDRAAGRFAVINAFVDMHLPKMQSTDAAVFTYLWRHANKQNVIKISHNAIKEGVGKSRSTIIRSITRLEESKAVRCLKKGGTDHDQNTYKLTAN